MNAEQANLARKQLERRLAPLRAISFAPPPKGWIRAIRDSLGMTVRQLARRTGVSPSRIPAIEMAEITGATTIKTLREVAEAMECTFVYAFVPTRPLDEILRDRATQRAQTDIARLEHTMRLENQSLNATDMETERQRMIDAIASGSLRCLWDEQDHRG